MQDVILLKITAITDDSTGIYQIGDLDFGKTGHCENFFLEKPGNRKKFVRWLRWLANAAEKGTAPFLPHDKSPDEKEAPGNQGSLMDNCPESSSCSGL